MNKIHYPEINIYRGLGIMLVVLGHALKQTGETNTMFAVMLSVIYSFHMPLFFVASGFTSIKILDLCSKQEKISFLKNRAKRLLIPYLAVGLFYMPIKYILSSFAVKPYDFSNSWKLLIGENPNTVLWFLYTLFVVSLICTILLTRKNLKVLLILSMLLSVAAYIADTPFNTAKYLFFFIAGIYLRDNYKKIQPLLKSKLLYPSLLIFIIFNTILYVTMQFGWNFITAVSGCILFLGISIRISSSSGWINKVTNLCGAYSMDIYILSDLIATAFRILLWGIIGIHYIPCTVICFIVSILLPVPISKYIIRRIKLLKLLILGQ